VVEIKIHEANLPTQCHQAKAHPWVSRQNGDKSGPKSPEPSQGTR